MIAPCSHENFKRAGKNRNGTQRYRCNDCGVRFSDDKPLGHMRIDLEKAAFALNLLLEGMSIRATERMTGFHRDTLCDLILVAGEKCQTFMDAHCVNVQADDLQMDELWSFVGMKQKRAKAKGTTDEYGDSYTFFAIDRNTKLIPAFHVGSRTNEHAERFMAKVAKAIDTDRRFQVTTDGFTGYRYAVPLSLGGRVDFAQLIKVYAASQTETRYSPAIIISAEKVVRFGTPAEGKICTSHVERANLTVRMQLRRFTRLTNGFSKSHKHHEAMQAIFFCHYNFCRVHSTIKQTPAMASGLTEHVLSIHELLESNEN